MLGVHCEQQVWSSLKLTIDMVPLLAEMAHVIH